MSMLCVVFCIIFFLTKANYIVGCINAFFICNLYLHYWEGGKVLTCFLLFSNFIETVELGSKEYEFVIHFVNMCYITTIHGNNGGIELHSQASLSLSR